VTPRAATLGALALGGAAVVAATLVGQDHARLDAIVNPPALIRALLVGGSAALAVILLGRGLTRLAAGTTDVPGLVRGVRLVFLAVAAIAAGAGWALGNALPLVIALVIAGIDVVETSFLLLVVAAGQVNRER
jgi:hypothetical protein